MRKSVYTLITLAVFLVCFAANIYAQSATGSIAGTVTDATGAVIPNAKLTITNKATNAVRNLTTNAEGIYTAPGLETGTYQVRSEQEGFKTLERDADVLAGTATNVNMQLAVGAASEVVNVEAAGAQVNYESHNVAGSVEQKTIDNIPLNGRNFLMLGAQEPGVTIVSQAQGTRNAPITVSILGGGQSVAGTLFTMDGMQINDFHDTGTAINFSQEVIQEFQLSSANFDLASGITMSGAVNLVTRSGGNDWHASLYAFYRDHNMASYPGLKRLPAPAPTSPYFKRQDPGVWVSGPIIKDKLFMFASYERIDQRAAVVVTPDLPSTQAMQNVSTSPNDYDYTTVRFDYRVSPNNNAFVRWTNDHNTGLGVNAGLPGPSNWTNNYNWSDQMIGVLTTTFGATKVNELRFAYRDWENNELYPTPAQCAQLSGSQPCLGLNQPINNLDGYGNDVAPISLPQLLMNIGPNPSAAFETGGNGNIPQNRISRNYETLDAFTWQRGTHRLKFSGDLDYYRELFNFPLCTVGCIDVESVESTQSILGASTSKYLPQLPASIHTNADLLNLPAYFPLPTLYNGFEAGPGTTPGPWHFPSERRDMRPRVFIQDTWKYHPNLTFNYGLAYQYESGLWPSDMPISGILAPIYGLPAGTQQPGTPNVKTEFSPSIGFAWSPGKSGKTVVRGGGGLYWDTSNFTEKLHAQTAVGPVGNGVDRFGAAVFDNIYPGIVAGNSLSTLQPVPIGSPLPSTTFMNLTLGQFMALYNAQYPADNSLVTLANPLTHGAYALANNDFLKQGEELFDPHQKIPHSWQTSIGVQRDLGHELLVAADWVRRQGEATNVGEIDYNHYNEYQLNSAGTYVKAPVIPTCGAGVPALGAGYQCSEGPFTVYTNQGRNVYEGLLAKLSKRFSRNYQFTVSYALQNLNAENVRNLNNWFEGYGNILAHQNLNISGIYNMPWGFTLSLNSTMQTRTPVVPTIGVDITGTGGASSTALFGNAANPGAYAGLWSDSQLQTAVANFNAKYAGTKTPSGSTIGTYVLPANYQLGKPTIAQDFRLTKLFKFKEKYQFSLYGEVFNAFNIANLTTYGFSLTTNAATSAFGQPTQRAGQTFLSSGPRAEQLGARIQF